jgi:hypothetical protein
VNDKKMYLSTDGTSMRMSVLRPDPGLPDFIGTTFQNGKIIPNNKINQSNIRYSKMP